MSTLLRGNKPSARASRNSRRGGRGGRTASGAADPVSSKSKAHSQSHTKGPATVLGASAADRQELSGLSQTIQNTDINIKQALSPQAQIQTILFEKSD